MSSEPNSDRAKCVCGWIVPAIELVVSSDVELAADDCVLEVKITLFCPSCNIGFTQVQSSHVVERVEQLEQPEPATWPAGLEDLGAVIGAALQPSQEQMRYSVRNQWNTISAILKAEFPELFGPDVRIEQLDEVKARFPAVGSRCAELWDEAFQLLAKRHDIDPSTGWFPEKGEQSQ